MIEYQAASTADEETWLKLLDGLRPLEISTNEAKLITRIARFNPSPRVLESLSLVPKWYARWEIREALYENPRTPERFREPIGSSIAIIDLMREMDSRRLHDAERDEIREDIRSLLKQLPPVDHEVVKAHARSLAAAPRMQPEDNAPEAVPTPQDRAAEDLEVHRAARAATEEELLALLADRRERVRRAAMESLRLQEGILLEALRRTTEAQFLTEVATHPRWSFADPIRRSVLEHPLTPPATYSVLSASLQVLNSFMRYFNEPLEPDERAWLAKTLLGEVQELPGTEKDYVKYKVGEAWGPFVKQVMSDIEEEFRRARPRPVSTAWPAPRPLPVEPEPAARPSPRRGSEISPGPRPDPLPERAPAASFDAERHPAGRLHAPAPGAETTRMLASLSVEERSEIAASTTNRDELGFLLHDPDPRVFAALLENPALGEEEIVAAARNAAPERIEHLRRSRRSWALGSVKVALLHNPAAGERLQIECLGHVGGVRELMHVMRDPRVRSLEVKAKARARLLERYRTMSSEERVSAIKSTGGDLLNDVWNDAFADERTLLRLLQDRSVDEGVVLKIARSRVAPREVLAAIGRDPGWTNQYPVRLELATNPKTPREIVAKLLPKLAPADRQRLKASGHSSDFVRDLA